jgi:hypothetical protein
VVADLNGDGAVDLALPSFDRRSIRLISFKGGMREIGRHVLPAAASGDFSLARKDGETAIRVPLANGAVSAVVP